MSRWNDDGSEQAPRFTGTGAYGEQPDRTTPTAETAARQAAAAATAPQSATDAATVQKEELARWQKALDASDEAAAHAARHEMWEALSELFSRTAELAATSAGHGARPSCPTRRLSAEEVFVVIDGSRHRAGKRRATPAGTLRRGVPAAG